MWIALNDSFLSIVASPPPHQDQLAVRARARGDIEAVFGKAYKVISLDARDYAFRAFIPREVVAAKLAERVLAIEYGNFKDSVKQNDRHDTYFRIWNAMADFQDKRGHGRPYQTTKSGKGRKDQKGFLKPVGDLFDWDHDSVYGTNHRGFLSEPYYGPMDDPRTDDEVDPDVLTIEEMDAAEEAGEFVPRSRRPRGRR